MGFQNFCKFPPTLAEELKEKAKALEKRPNGTVDDNEKNTNDAKEMKKKKKKKAAGLAKKKKEVEDDDLVYLILQPNKRPRQ